MVMVNVRSIAEMGAYVTLSEYNDIEGMILLSEVRRTVSVARRPSPPSVLTTATSQYNSHPPSALPVNMGTDFLLLPFA